MFNVDAARPGIQQLTIPKTGIYEISAYGAGNYDFGDKPGLGIVFNHIMNFTFPKILDIIFRTDPPRHLTQQLKTFEN